VDGFVILDGAARGKAAAGGLLDCGVLKADVLGIYQQMLPHEVLDQIRQQENIREYTRVYSSSVVMWLMIGQRLHSNGTLETAVQELLGGLPESFWPNPCKRVEMWRQDGEWKPSSYTGAYNTARQELSLKLVEQSSDRIFPQLTEHIAGCLPGVNRRAFFFDGTTVRLPHTEALREAYPPTANQHGESHWPLFRMLVAHDAHTGLAMRPEYGPVNGSEAVSEQGLLETLVERLPPAAVVIGDANFGVFSVAWAAIQCRHPVLLRLTKARAQRLAGTEPLRDGIDRRIAWKPSREDRQSHPQLPVDACVQGRLIVSKVQPSDGSEPILLALFTTLDDDQNQLIALYGRRWDIETDLRSLKQTLRLEQLTCTTTEMVAKELVLAMIAYNLVRAVICLAAQKVGIAPRRYSFTKVRNLIQTFAHRIANAKNEDETQKHVDTLMYYVEQAKFPKRKTKRRSYPRAVWPKPKSFPARHNDPVVLAQKA
jgi:hypothetical protein